MSHPVVVATNRIHLLAESPVWDGVTERLLWVDIQAGEIHTGRLREDGTIDAELAASIEETVGAVALVADGGWVVAGARSLFFRGADGGLRAGPQVVRDGEPRRLNDGKVDPAGRYLVGTLCLDPDIDSGSETLVRLEHDGSLSVLDDDLGLSNGLGWSTDGSRFYSIDSTRQVVHVRSYDVATGRTGTREVLIRLQRGYPDGMCVDADDHLWVAVWGEGQVRRYAPDGRHVSTIEVPAPHTSSVAFAGPELDTLVITTATQDLDEAQLADHPDSGRVFTTRPGVRGLPSVMMQA